MRHDFTPGSVTDAILYFHDLMSSATLAFAERFFQIKHIEEGAFSSNLLKLANTLSDKLTDFNSAINKFCINENSTSLFLNLIRQESTDILAYAAAIIHEVDIRKEKSSAIESGVHVISNISKSLSSTIRCHKCKAGVSFSSKTPKAHVFRALISRGWIVNSKQILCKSCAAKALQP